MEDEVIPMHEYQQFPKEVKPKPNSARAWAKLNFQYADASDHLHVSGDKP
jgi:hypothetical protein